ncbi:uncharacterized protein METZ01_LOCUS493618, partial [marine metagenome]
EKLGKLPLAEKNLGTLLLLFLLTQFFVYAYSGLKWPTLSQYIDNTFIHPGNSINLSDTRGTIAIYPAFVFFIFCFKNIRDRIKSGQVKWFLFAVIGVNLVLVTTIFAIPRVKFIVDNLDKSYEERAENSGSSDMPNQFKATYQVAHELKKRIKKGQSVFLPPGDSEGSVRSVMIQVLFPQNLHFANDSKFKKNLKGNTPSVYVTKGSDEVSRFCDDLNRVTLGKTGFFMCQPEKR